MRHKTSAVGLILGLSLTALFARSVWAAPPITISDGGVTAWTLESKFEGSMDFVRQNQWQTLSPDQLPATVDGRSVIATQRILVSFDTDTGDVTVYTRRANRLTRRGIVRAVPHQPTVKYQLVSGAGRGGLGIEVYGADDQLDYTLALSGDGLIEFKPAGAQQVSVSGIRLAHGIVPSLIGTDLVYDARRYPGRRTLHVPSMNLFTGLVQGNHCTMVCIWPPGDQAVRLQIGHEGEEGVIDSFSIDVDGRSFFLSFVEYPGIWHAEPLKDAYLEKDTVIDWKRPFPALWIGHFFVDSEEISYPFYFGPEKRKLWGRYIRSWYYYPCWFQGDKTYIHFEKKFPPNGEMLIYCLENRQSAAQAPSPVQLMRAALGEEAAARLLDFDGTQQRSLLAHGEAVCAMTNKMQEMFDVGAEVQQKAHIATRADDVADFIGMIRERILEYGQFAKQMNETLGAIEQAEGASADALLAVLDTVDEISLAAEEDLPDVTLDEVRLWTEEIKYLSQKVRPTNAKRYAVLGRQCRSVAGSQDDLARELCVLTIRLMEEAARMGVDSPKRVKVAEEIIAKSRQVLRRPTWWEPRRYDFPKSNPGIP